MPQRVTGKVKFYKQDKGWGFIEVSRERDVFVHRSALGSLPHLLADQRVTFEIVDGNGGKPAAANVELA